VNVPLNSPEFVLVGPKSSGKSSFLELFFGHPFYNEKQSETKRLLIVNAINNSTKVQPLISFKSDLDFKQFTTTNSSDIPNEIQKRTASSDYDDEPLVINYEYKEFLNFTFIDTPSLTDNENVVEFISSHLKQTDTNTRTILYFTEAKNWRDSFSMQRILNKIDPKLSRTIVVYSKLYQLLEVMKTPDELQIFIESTQKYPKSYYFSSVPNPAKQEKLREKLQLCDLRDTDILDQLLFDTSFNALIGSSLIRNDLWNEIWKFHKAQAPRIQTGITKMREVAEEKLKHILKKQEDLAISKLRLSANNYASSFASTIAAVLEGTGEVNVSLFGQTLEGEKEDNGYGDWFPRGSVIKSVKVNLATTKLYGLKQLQRLLTEFREITNSVDIEIRAEDISRSHAQQPSELAYEISDFVSVRSKRQLEPLVKHVLQRASYILKRIVDVPIKLNNSGNFHYLSDRIKQSFYEFVDKNMEITRQKCASEFYETKLIVWDVMFDKKFDKNIKINFATLTPQLYTKIRSRVIENTILKIYEFLVIPITTTLQAEVIKTVSLIDDKLLAELFQVNSTRELIKTHETKHKEEIVSLDSKADILRKTIIPKLFLPA